MRHAYSKLPMPAGRARPGEPFNHKSGQIELRQGRLRSATSGKRGRLIATKRNLLSSSVVSTRDELFQRGNGTGYGVCTGATVGTNNSYAGKPQDWRKGAAVAPARTNPAD